MLNKLSPRGGASPSEGGGLAAGEAERGGGEERGGREGREGDGEGLRPSGIPFIKYSMALSAEPKAARRATRIWSFSNPISAIISTFVSNSASCAESWGAGGDTSFSSEGGGVGVGEGEGEGTCSWSWEGEGGEGGGEEVPFSSEGNGEEDSFSSAGDGAGEEAGDGAEGEEEEGGEEGLAFFGARTINTHLDPSFNP